MNFSLAFPTDLHRQSAEVARDFFLNSPIVDTILVTNSCARGQATPESDLDMVVLLAQDIPSEEIQALESKWQNVLHAHPVIADFYKSHRFMQIHLDVITGIYTPSIWEDGGGPDGFELELGNHLAYSAVFSEPGDHFKQLQAEWLPYYSADLQRQRLAMARRACIYDLEHLSLYHKRGLHFQAFDRLYKAFQIFLQALFISRKVYPLAYNKWIRMQVEEWLGLPELYRELPQIISVSNIEGNDLLQKAEKLNELLDYWTPE
jgi:predicted nucleotidyltransferase